MSVATAPRQVGRDAHRPTDGESLAREARRLCAQGLTHRDVAAALRLSEGAVRAALEASQGQQIRGVY